MKLFIFSRKSEKKSRAVTATKASKARALPKFWDTVNPISTRGAYYAHHSTMGLVWLKFAVAALQGSCSQKRTEVGRGGAIGKT